MRLVLLLTATALWMGARGDYLQTNLYQGRFCTVRTRAKAACAAAASAVVCLSFPVLGAATDPPPSRSQVALIYQQGSGGGGGNTASPTVTPASGSFTGLPYLTVRCVPARRAAARRDATRALASSLPPPPFLARFRSLLADCVEFRLRGEYVRRSARLAVPSPTPRSAASPHPARHASLPPLPHLSYKISTVTYYGSQMFRCFNSTHAQLNIWSGTTSPTDPSALCQGPPSSTNRPTIVAPLAGQPGVTVASGSGNLPCLAFGAGNSYSQTAYCQATGNYRIQSAYSSVFYEYNPCVAVHRERCLDSVVCRRELAAGTATPLPPLPSLFSPLHSLPLQQPANSICTNNDGVSDVYIYDLVDNYNFPTPGQCYPMLLRPSDATSLASLWFQCSANMDVYFDNATATCSAANPLTFGQYSTPSTAGVSACIFNQDLADPGQQQVR